MNQNPSKEIPRDLLKRILADKAVLTALVGRSFFHFFYVFFGEYVRHPMAPFHREMFRYAEDDSVKRIVVVAFRTSAKSTIYNTALPLWAVTGKLRKRHVVIACHTQQRAYDSSVNIAREVEKNSILRKYLGPFEERQERWSTPVRTLPKYGARISFVSAEEGIRGLREGPNRPDLIIVDDIEDQSSTKTKEGRDKIFQWLTGELIPAGDIHTKIVLIGNYLHEDSALVRFMQLMQNGKMDGKFLRVPIIDDNGNIAWPGKFPSMKAIEEFKRGIGNEFMWQLEFMLRRVPEKNQTIKPEEIHYYEAKPKANYLEDGNRVSVEPHIKCTGVDLAISQKENADFTAMVTGEIIYLNGVPKLYIDPFPFKDKVTFHRTIEQAKALHQASGGAHHFFVENVAYQQVAIEEFTRNGFYVTPMQALQDKHSRYEVAAVYIKNGAVLFPKQGCEELLQQMFYLGSESHDDLSDALVYLILGVMHTGEVDRPEICFL